jgi:hypothetical protein
MALKKMARNKSSTKASGKTKTKKKIVKEVQRRKSRASVTLKRTSGKAAPKATKNNQETLCYRLH